MAVDKNNLLLHVKHALSKMATFNNISKVMPRITYVSCKMKFNKMGAFKSRVSNKLGQLRSIKNQFVFTI